MFGLAAYTVTRTARTMKRLLCPALIMLLCTTSVIAEPVIRVHTQLCELPAAARLPKDITQVARMRGADSLVAPDSQTGSGEVVKVSVGRDLEIGGKGTFPTGVVLSIRPTLHGERFDYSVDYERTEFLSFAPRSATQAPVLNTRRIVGMEGQSGDGEAVWLDLGIREDEQTIRERGKPNPDAHDPQPAHRHSHLHQGVTGSSGGLRLRARLRLLLLFCQPPALS